MAPAIWNSRHRILRLRPPLQRLLPLLHLRRRSLLRSRIRLARSRLAACHRTIPTRSRKQPPRLRNNKLSPIGERGRALPELIRKPPEREAFLFEGANSLFHKFSELAQAQRRVASHVVLQPAEMT